ncbi:MAG: hypothetical protein K2N82_01500, partial [Lachnospiraceae bacterium]|nr:hypothetical protein [Lachnospiraceae bacterium]
MLLFYSLFKIVCPLKIGYNCTNKSKLAGEIVMASRIIHLAITDCISKSYRYKDKNRLELGSILPDAVT